MITLVVDSQCLLGKNSIVSTLCWHCTAKTNFEVADIFNVNGLGDATAAFNELGEGDFNNIIGATDGCLIPIAKPLSDYHQRRGG